MDMTGTSSVESAVEMERHEEQGFMLVGLIVAIFFVLLALSVAAPKMAQELRREREVEAVHRGNQYVRAIRLYYRKFGHYPGSIEQLEKTNNIRFLRQRYVDPMTGKADWGLRSTSDDWDSTTWGGTNVFDVYSKSTGTALDGTKYSDW